MKTKYVPYVYLYIITIGQRRQFWIALRKDLSTIRKKTSCQVGDTCVIIPTPRAYC
ncbi:MAG: hypothetical protein ACFFC5_07250 [Promethearchaeota archaeon]